MKTIIVILIHAVLLAGCKTTGQARAYKTLAAIQTAQVAAMETYRELSLAGEIDDEERAKVKEAYERFQKAFGLALAAAEFDYKDAAPLDLIDHFTSLERLISTL